MTQHFATIKDWQSLSGIGRTSTYYLIAQGHLKAVKVGKRTLLDVDAGLAWLRSRPAAEITSARRPSKAA